MREEDIIRIEFQNILDKLVSSKIKPTATAIISARQPMVQLFEELIYKINKLQKENTELENELSKLQCDYRQLYKENTELKEKNTILEGNKIGYKLAIQELKEKLDYYSYYKEKESQEFDERDYYEE